MFGKRPSDLTAADLERLVAEGVPEGSQVELKGALPGQRGKADPWSEGKDQVSEAARNKLIAEVIAFANAYGGWLLVGVEETKTKPARAEAIAPIRNCADLADRLRLQCRDCIEPQLPILEVEGVTTDDEGAGVVVFHVPRSRMAPHRHTITKECYFRRADRTEKMTMREIQDLTIQTERGMAGIEATLDQCQAAFADELGEFSKAGTPAFGVRVTGVPTTPLFIERVHGNEAVRPPLISIPSSQSDLFVPATGLEWRPVLRGTRCSAGDDYLLCVREVNCDGVVKYQLFYRRRADPFVIYPAWVMGLLVNGMCAVELFRCAASAPDAEYALDIEIWPVGGSVDISTYDKNLYHNYYGPFPGDTTRFSLYSLGSRGSFGEVAALFERDFLNAAGEDWDREISVDFDSAFRQLGLLAAKP